MSDTLQLHRIQRYLKGFMLQMTEVSVFGLNRNQGISKGCGYVSYKERSAAEAALANLNEKRTLPVSHLRFIAINRS